MDLLLRKIAARCELKRIAATFSPDYVEEASRAVCETVLQSREFLLADVVFGYLAFNNEISVDKVLQEALRMGKTVAVPRIVSKTEMQAALLQTMDRLPVDRYGIRTVPEPASLVAPERIDLIVVPGAGFTLTGCRMGRGAGYYDRFLEKTGGFTLGITCERLVREQIPMDRFDSKVEALVTEKRFIRCIDM